MLEDDYDLEGAAEQIAGCDKVSARVLVVACTNDPRPDAVTGVWSQRCPTHPGSRSKAPATCGSDRAVASTTRIRSGIT
jgi:hypothetical protein